MKSNENVSKTLLLPTESLFYQVARVPRPRRRRPFWTPPEHVFCDVPTPRPSKTLCFSQVFSSRPSLQPSTAILDPSRTRVLQCSSPSAIKNVAFSQFFSSRPSLQPSTAILDPSRTRVLRCSSPSATKNVVFSKVSGHPSLQASIRRAPRRSGRSPLGLPISPTQVG